MSALQVLRRLTQTIRIVTTVTNSYITPSTQEPTEETGDMIVIYVKGVGSVPARLAQSTALLQQRNENVRIESLFSEPAFELL